MENTKQQEVGLEATIKKICRICGLLKSLDCFSIKKEATSGFQPLCKPCDNLRRRKDYLLSTEKDRLERKRLKLNFIPPVGRECSVCQKYKLLNTDNFFRSSIAIAGFGYRCKPCDKIAKSNWYKKNKERATMSSKNRTWKHKFGVTVEWYKTQLMAQNGCCAICRSDKNKGRFGTYFVIDHNHSSGKIRGLLCNTCNRTLGMFKEDPAILRRGAEYIENDGVVNE